MVACNQNTLNKILDIVSIAQNHMEVNSLRKNLLPSIQQLFNSSSCTFFIPDEHENLMDHENMMGPITIGIDDSFLKHYKAHYYKQNPFDPSFIKSNIPLHQDTQVIIDTDIFKMSEFVKTEYYNDFLKPQKIHNQMVLFLRSKGKLSGFLGIHRSKGDKKFEDTELKIGSILGPHLTSALKNAQSYSKIKEKKDFYHTISECTSTGFFILNKDLCVIYANSKGFEICHKIAKDFSLNCKTPTFFLPSILYKVASNLKKEWGHKQILENIAGGKHLVNLKAFDNQLVSSDENHYLLSVEELPSTNVIDDDRLKKEFALSTREIEVITYIYKGFKNLEIAESLSISEGTVKSHVKNIFRKTGVENRTSLIHEAISV